MNTHTQKLEILRALKAHRQLTPIAALRLYGCFRLAARIWELRQEGHEIIADSIEVNGKRVRCYWMA